MSFSNVSFLRVKSLAWLLLCSILPGGAVAQRHDSIVPVAQVRNYSIEQGLSNRNVNYITRDKQGFLWIATFNGLNRFDGYDFLNYDSRPQNKHKIRFAKIHAVLPDRAGNLLVCYEDPQKGPVDLLDPLTGQIDTFPFARSAGFTGKFNEFFQAPDGALYFHTLEAGNVVLYRFDEPKRQFTQVFKAIHPEVNEDCFFSFLKAGDGTFWFAYNWENRDVRVIHTAADGRTIRMYGPADFSLPPGNTRGWVALAESPDGNIWFSLYSRGVYVLGTSGAFHRHPQLPQTGYFFARDKKGNLLAYQTTPENPAQGCYLATAGGKLTDYSWLYGYQVKISSVFSEDFTKGLMAGTGNGFNSYWLRPHRFKTLLSKNLGNAPYGISARGICKVGRDHLFIATELDGLYELNLKTGFMDRPGDRLPALALLNQFKFPRNLLAGGDSILWVSGLGGIVRFDILKNTLTFFKTYTGEKATSNDEAWGISFGPDGYLWIVLRDGRLLRVDPVSGQASPYLNKDGTPPLASAQPSFILAGHDGVFWLGTASNGLVRMDPGTGESRRFTANPGDPSGFNSNQITCIYEDDNGLLWVGTMESGLHVFDPKQGKVLAIYSRENGLRNNSPVGILPDAQGNYWVSTFSGLSYFDTRLKTFRNYTTADGLSHDEFNRFSYFFDRDDGRFYFGGMNGVNTFDQKDLNQGINDAPLLISEMSVAGLKDSMVVQQEGLVDGALVALAPGSRFLRLKLALGTYYNPDGNQFSYKIDGLDNDWNYLGTNRELRLDRLPAGAYTLHLRGADERGNWSERTVALRLVVREFWYRRWWAYLLYAGLLAAGSYYFYRFQLRRSIAEKETQRLQQLDAFKSRFFTNISHEFRTPLTVIIGLVDSLRAHFAAGAKTEFDHSTEMVRRNGQQLLNLVNQLLELSRLESGKLELSLSNGDLVAFLRYQLESYHSYAETHRIRLQFVEGLPDLMMAFDHEKVQTILANLISNALKFTSSGGEVVVAVTAEPAGQSPGQVVIRVRDTGTGIPADRLPRIFDRFYQVDDSNTRKGEGTGIGLALVQELVKLMQGQITVESTLTVGTEFRIILPYTPPLPGLQPMPAAPVVENFSAEKGIPPVAEDDEEDRRPLLLIVEDNPDVRFFIATCVTSDYRVLVAENGAAGIERAIERIPDIIVSDVMMPEKDGFDLCEALKNDERTSHIPIVLLTARVDFESRIAGLRRGADDYLAKPFEPDELLVRLENLVKLRRRLQQRYGALAQLPPLPSDDPALVLEDAFLLKIRDVVEAHLSDTEFEMPQLERALGMSRSQVFRKVKALTGASPSVLIRSIRLHKAKELLQDHALTIAEVAYEVGFSTPAYFSTSFLEAFGKTPSAWREG